MISDISNIAIKPFSKACNSRVKMPGSKSISNRALILSVMCEGDVELQDILQSEDVALMQEALTDLGVCITKTKNGVIVKGTGGEIPNSESTINVGNAGTIARFLTCLLAAQSAGEYLMDGTEAMRNRPMLELLSCLEKLGSKIEYRDKEGHFPFNLKCNGLYGNAIRIDARKSGQNISGLIMQAPRLGNKCNITFAEGTVSLPFIDMTLKMIGKFNEDKSYNYDLSRNSLEINNCAYKKGSFVYKVEPDATAASYFLTLPLVVGGECLVEGLKVDMLQGDIAYCDILKSIGGRIEYNPDGVKSIFNNTLDGGTFNFVDISDTFLTLAAISPLLGSNLEICGIEHTRKQETDRVSAMATELKKLGQDVTEKSDRLIITPNLNKLRKLAEHGVNIDTYNDHRFAMSFAILGSFDLYGTGKSWLTINNPLCCSKTFPDFFDCLNTAREHSYSEK